MDYLPLYRAALLEACEKCSRTLVAYVMALGKFNVAEPYSRMEFKFDMHLSKIKNAAVTVAETSEWLANCEDFDCFGISMVVSKLTPTGIYQLLTFTSFYQQAITVFLFTEPGFLSHFKDAISS